MRGGKRPGQSYRAPGSRLTEFLEQSISSPALYRYATEWYYSQTDGSRWEQAIVQQLWNASELYQCLFLPSSCVLLTMTLLKRRELPVRRARKAHFTDRVVRH